jgi:group II intron reverse transcriptase/maturase
VINSSRNKDGRFSNLLSIIADPNVLILAYLNIKGKPGNMTKGVTSKGNVPETLDGIDITYFDRLSIRLKSGNYSFSPVRTVMVPKQGKVEKRTLGEPNPREKIVQKAIFMVLSTIYEPIFLPCSYGFRPGRGCHTALRDIQNRHGNSFVWAIEGEISKCFDRIPHEVILRLIGRQIDCPPTISLIKKSLRAGFICPETKRLVVPKKGTPQGNVLSPILVNIVLHEFDVYMCKVLGPAFNVGKSRRRNSEHRRAGDIIERIKKDRNKFTDQQFKLVIREQASLMRRHPYYDLLDTSFKRLAYFRYADAWIAIMIGSKTDATQLKSLAGEFISKLGLELGDTKTKITHLMRDKAYFLGFYLTRYKTYGKAKLSVPTNMIEVKGSRVKSRVTPKLVLLVPIHKLLEKLQAAGFLKRNKYGTWIPISVPKMIMLPHSRILQLYNSKIRGIWNYYRPANNIAKLYYVFWLLKASCAITLARKFKIGQKTISAAMSKFGKSLSTVDEKGKRVEFWSPPNWKRLPLENRFCVNEHFNLDQLIQAVWTGSATLPQFGETCVVCGSPNVEIHHLRRVADIRHKYANKGTGSGGVTFQQWVPHGSRATSHGSRAPRSHYTPGPTRVSAGP